MSDPFLSIVVPVYNEEEVLSEFHSRLFKTLKGFKVSSEIIYVDDGSKDRSAEILSQIRAQTPNVRVLRFSRNFGHQIALKAGIDYAKGEAVGTIDADLQDPPELFADMLLEWEKGYDVVYAMRAKRDGETFFKKWTAAIFYRTLRSLSSVKLPLDTGDFRLMSKSIADVIRGIDEKDPYIRGWVAYAAKNPKPIAIHRQARFAGQTKYSLSKMLKLAANGFWQFSPLGRLTRRAGKKTATPVYVLMPDESK